MPFDPPLFLIGTIAGWIAGFIAAALVYRPSLANAERMLKEAERGIARANGLIRSLERRLEYSDRIIDQQAKAVRASRRPSLPRTEDAPWPSPSRIAPVGSVVGEKPSSSLDDLALGAVAGAIIASDSGSDGSGSGSGSSDGGGD